MSRSVRAIASASAMTARCSASRPSGHSAQALMRSARTRNAGSRGAGLAERLLDPVDRIRVAVARQPVLAERRTQFERLDCALSWRTAHLERGVDVVELGVEPGEVLLAARAAERLRSAVALGQRQEVAVVALADRFAVGDARQSARRRRRGPFPASPAGCAHRTVAAHEQALGDKPVERVDAGAGDRLRRLHRGAAGEHREAREARLLVIAEQLVAPVDRRAQRPLAGGRVARPRRRAPPSAASQAFGDLAREKAARSARPRARSPAAARRRVGRSPRPRAVALAQLEPGVVRSRALAEQRDGVDVAPASRGSRSALRAARAAARGSAARPARRAVRGSWPAR